MNCRTTFNYLFSGICIYILLLFSSCNNKKYKLQKYVKERIGKEIKLPMLGSNKTAGALKIITRVNGNCPPCINNLTEWNKFYAELSVKVPIIIYVVGNDSLLLLNIPKDNLKFNSQIIYDKNDSFKRINKLAPYDIFHTMLVDEQNKILLLGTPIGNSIIQELYNKTIKNRK